MPKSNRRESANGLAPLITFDEVAAEKESFRLSWTVLANIREYAAYVKDVTGKETTPDEVADKALQRLFDADKGFRQWLQKKNGEGKVSTLQITFGWSDDHLYRFFIHGKREPHSPRFIELFFGLVEKNFNCR